MAFTDWNHNGKNDLQDDLIEYQIYHDCMKDDNANITGGNRRGGLGCGGTILVILGILFVITLIGMGMDSCAPKCIKEGCNNKREEGSMYCILHENQGHHYSAPSGSSSHDYENHSYNFDDDDDDSLFSDSPDSDTPSDSEPSDFDTPSDSEPSDFDTPSDSEPSDSDSFSDSKPSYGHPGGTGGGTLYGDTSTKSSSPKSSSGGTSSKKKETDPYNAKDYSDAEEFYDDNYDDFDSYEDAEMYYEDAMDE